MGAVVADLKSPEEKGAGKFLPGPTTFLQTAFNMKWTFLLLVLMLQTSDLKSQVQLPESDQPPDPPTHLIWDRLLRKHVSPDGSVDYRGFASDRESLTSYLETLSGQIPSVQWSREARLAYFINLYNAATVLLILDHYPLESIRDISRPWGKKRVQLGDQQYSLGEIEHGILRKMDEPRIHFAINCASLSCPKLLPQAFMEKTLESQLDMAARGFIADPMRNKFREGEARLSKIFKWYRQDFTAGDAPLIEYINRYLPEPLPSNTPVSYLPYDWSLNEKKG